MTFSEIIALQPAWVGVWLNVLVLCCMGLPVVLMIWRASRKIGAIALAVSLVAGFGVQAMFAQMGYVRLLGLPHVILWTPLVIYLIRQWKHAELPRVPRALIAVIITALVVSLAFDYVDVARYFLGERTPFTG